MPVTKLTQTISKVLFRKVDWDLKLLPFYIVNGTKRLKRLLVMQTTMKNYVKTSFLQHALRIILGAFMVFAAIGHLTFQREEFQALVPIWLPLSKDLVVIFSGIVELVLGLGMLFWKNQRVTIGIALAVFFILIFPGNVSQYTNSTDAFGLDTDRARLIRLFFQPVLVVWALWSTGVFKALKRRSPN